MGGRIGKLEPAYLSVRKRVLNSANGQYVLRTETIKVEVVGALTKGFRKKAMGVYGYKKGAMKKVLEEAMRRFSTPGEVEWKSLKGVLRQRGMSSVELQHRVWSNQD